jgi:hypothetical protein
MPSLCFQTQEFPTAPEGDLDYCNGQPGSVLAAWVRELLAEAGISGGELIQEDYGWGFWLEHEATVWVAVSFAGAGDPMPEWWIGVEHEIPFFAPQQWFKQQVGRAVVAQAYGIISEALHRRPGVIIQQLPNPTP